ncbi:MULTISPECIES: exosortase family protein XrtM [Methylomonas]|uniref:Exosortase family protein XrtM n=1 Tax=Methylomonas koyamae TaxID=702114 RepID=A0AA91DHU0_9GAMM|nr:MULTISPECIES: exosortase family protein XrtM [Methylomonas]ANE58012.1 exosortase XrtM [Methylomonas sp. DH-1]OAI30272.1 exosortase family protein XrtM [Methylomonas koyamae]
MKKYGWLQCILFIGCYLLLNAAYFNIPFNLFSQVLYYHGVVSICADLVNLVAPLEQVAATQNHLISAKADLEIVRGCDGAGVLFLIVSAIVVFPAKFGRKLIGLGLGISLIYSINLLRICVLYFVIAYHPDWLQLLHIYVAPTLMVIVGCLYFAWWAFVSTSQLHEPA